MNKAVAPLARYAQDVDKEPMILTVDGRPVAALLSVENVDLETMTLSAHPDFLEIIEYARSHQREEGGITSEEMRRRLGV